MPPLKSGLTVEGLRVLKLLVDNYGMSEPNALRLMKDGGPALAVALLAIAR